MTSYSGLASCLSCCECGVPIAYNQLSMCESCMVNLVDITRSISKQVSIGHCFTCKRFLSPPSFWIAENNKEQLLQACLKMIRGLSKLRVKDAHFLWTESHSKRLKVEVVAQQDVAEAGGTGAAAVEQTFVVEFVLQSHICEDCQREAAKDYFNANVQVRQRTSHKKTMFYMEQIILKANAHKDCINIKKVAGGVDFFFSSKSHATTFVQFLQRKLPIRFTESKKLISHDIHNSNYNYKYTYCVELPPICKDDLVCLPKALAQKLGNLSQLCVVHRITESIHLMDPVTAKVRHIDAGLYFQHGFQTVGSSRNLTPFLVVDTESVPPSKPCPGDCAVSKKHVLVDAYVYRESEMTEQLVVRTHLGSLIRTGDTFLGIDMRFLNHNNTELDAIDSSRIPDVVLIKKSYDRTLRRRARKWDVKRLQFDEESNNTDGEDQQEFFEDIEEDPEIRANVNLYQYRTETEVDNEAQIAELPLVPLEEMIRNLDLSAPPTENRFGSVTVDEHIEGSTDAEMMDC